MTTPVLTPAQMHDVDAAAPEPVEALIDRAGAAVARAALRMLGGAYGRRVIVIAGPGNNGADGRVAARRLAARGVAVRVIDVADCPARLPSVDLVVDAAYGTGFHGEWKAPDVGSAKVLAVDIPSGVDGLTGVASRHTLAADATVTFAALKPGLLFADGVRLAGQVEVADIGLDVARATIHAVTAADVAAWLPQRAADDHKWSHAVRVVAGSRGMTGAAQLVAGAAQRAGAGMVQLSSPGLDAEAPVEVVATRLPPFDWADQVLTDLHRFHALVIGPGLGREDHTVPSVTRAIIESIVPVIVDGDGLFALSWNEDGAPTMLRGRDVATILTPHDGEYGLLTGHRPGADRIVAARRLAADTAATVLLKGPTTVVAAPRGRTYVITDGDARLATAGTGDVLSGIVAAMVASGLAAPEAAAAGAWIHARAALLGPRRGLVASDIIAAIPDVLSAL